MEAALLILNGVIVLAAVFMSLRDERLPPGQSPTSLFRHRESAAASKPARGWKPRGGPTTRPAPAAPVRPARAGSRRAASTIGPG